MALDGDHLAAIRVDGMLPALTNQLEAVLLKEPNQISALDT
jgi:hypothetical protein